MSPAGRRVLVTAAVVVLGPLAGCSGDPHEEYCEEVRTQQEDLAEAVAGGGATALLRALPVFEELRSAAPRDLRDEWEVVVGRVQELAEALEAADVDPATYDGGAPPEDLATAERTRIEAAARELGAPATVAALNGVQQQARDVCKTPLILGGRPVGPATQAAPVEGGVALPGGRRSD